MSRFAVISDVHGNLHALEAVLTRIAGLDVAEILCLGDIVGYGPYPDKCLDLVIKCCSTAIRGNHDDAVINPERVLEFNGPARDAIDWTRGVLGPLHLDALCRLRTMQQPYESVVCVHDSPVSAPTDYVHDAHIAAIAFGGLEDRICLLGHTHVPVVFEAPPTSGDEALTSADVRTHAAQPGVPISLQAPCRFICNPGSVGQPRDADPRSSFAVLDTEAWTFTVHRQEYDIVAAQHATQRAGLPTVLADRLEIGA